MDRQKIAAMVAALILIPVSAHALLWWDDDRAKQEKYRSRVEEQRIELQRLQFERMMEQNQELIEENRTMYQRSIRHISAMGGPGLIYGALAVFLGIILFLVYLLFRLARPATSNRRQTRYAPPVQYRPTGPTVGRLIDDEQTEIENQFKLLGE